MLKHRITLKKVKWNASYEWLVVRFSALLIFLYVVYLLCFICSTNVITYEIWHDFFSNKKTKIINLIILFSILIHGWIGISHVLVDYVKNSKLRCISTFMILMILFMYLFLGMTVIWSI